jgi:hypothetical protein
LLKGLTSTDCFEEIRTLLHTNPELQLIRECEKKVRKKSIQIIAILSVLISVFFAWGQFSIADEKIEKVEFIFMNELLETSEKAIEKGIPGYITATNIDEKYQELGTDNKVSFTYELEYTNFIETKKTSFIIIDAKSESGDILSVTLGDGKGEVCINDYVTYSLEEGKYNLDNYNSIRITITLTLPGNLPKVKIPVGLLGITSDVPIKIVNSGWVIIE